MTKGSIHPISPDLFIVEGDDCAPATGVYRCATRLYLLGTGVGRAQRAALHAIATSFETADELTLLGIDVAPRPRNNDDLIGALPASRRHHLTPLAGRSIDIVTRGGDRDVIQSSYDSPGIGRGVLIGQQWWPGWSLPNGGPAVIQLGAPTRLGFYLSTCRALILPQLRAQTEPDRTAEDQRKIVTIAQKLLDTDAVTVVSAAAGAPMHVTVARRILNPSRPETLRLF